jgi:CRP/FNR family transcriptional regulator
MALERIENSMVAAKGSVLFRQGEAPRGVFLLHKGKIRLYMHSPRRKLSYRKVEPGSILGFPATFSNSPYSLTAESLADCELGFVEAPEVIELMSKDSNLCFQALQSLSQEVRRLRKRQVSMLSAAALDGDQRASALKCTPR